MYEYVNDVLRTIRINPEDVILIRHTDRPPHHFRAAQETGFIKEYTAMQKAGFAKGKEYLMVFIGEPPTAARFFALYHIANRFPTRTGHVPEGYPNRTEIEAEGEYLELREERLPKGLASFTIEWGKGVKSWYQRATIEKAITELSFS